MVQDPSLELQWVFLAWNGGWFPRDSPYTRDHFQATIDWEERHRAELPTPRACVGDHVQFRWSKGLMEGGVREVTGTWRAGREFFITYLVHANGHVRDVPESYLV